jgi:hypothetical protein
MSQCEAHDMIMDELVHLRDNQGRLFERTDGITVDIAAMRGDINLVREIGLRTEEAVKEQNETMKEMKELIQKMGRPKSNKTLVAFIGACLGSGGLGGVVTAIIQAASHPHTP